VYKELINTIALLFYCKYSNYLYVKLCGVNKNKIFNINQDMHNWSQEIRTVEYFEVWTNQQ